MTEPPESRENRRCGFVAVIGAPNVGKSTLINRLVGTKVSIVSPKVQTTRARVLGIVQAKASQIVLVDTPGIFNPKRRMERAMVRAAWSGAEDADLVVLVVDSERGLDGDTGAIVDKLKQAGRRAILALNKIDRVPRSALLALTATFAAQGLFEPVFMISAQNGDGTGDLLAYLAMAVPEGEWLYPEDQLTDMPTRLWAAEITREHLYRRLHEELPYSVRVDTETWQERPDGSVRVDQTITLLRDSHKPIVLGAKGSLIKAIGTDARKEMEENLGFRVHLFLNVRVRADWQDDQEFYRDFGLEFDA
jgi:GTP-binding protein Era